MHPLRRAPRTDQTQKDTKAGFSLAPGLVKTAAAFLVFAGSSEAPATSGLVEALQIPFQCGSVAPKPVFVPAATAGLALFSDLDALYLDVQFTMTCPKLRFPSPIEACMRPSAAWLDQDSLSSFAGVDMPWPAL